MRWDVELNINKPQSSPLMWCPTECKWLFVSSGLYNRLFLIFRVYLLMRNSSILINFNRGYTYSIYLAIQGGYTGKRCFFFLAFFFYPSGIEMVMKCNIFRTFKGQILSDCKRKGNLSLRRGSIRRAAITTQTFEWKVESCCSNKIEDFPLSLAYLLGKRQGDIYFLFLATVKGHHFDKR